MSEISYLLFEVIDKWEDADPVRNNFQRVPLRHPLPTMQKTGRPIPIPQNY